MTMNKKELPLSVQLEHQLANPIYQKTYNLCVLLSEKIFEPIIKFFTK